MGGFIAEFYENGDKIPVKDFLDSLNVKMKKETGTDEKRKIGTKEIVAAFICCVVDFGIAQFGLLTLIQKAYSVLAYLAIPVILIPYLIHMEVTRFDTK